MRKVIVLLISFYLMNYSTGCSDGQRKERLNPCKPDSARSMDKESSASVMKKMRKKRRRKRRKKLMGKGFSEDDGVFKDSVDDDDDGGGSYNSEARQKVLVKAARRLSTSEKLRVKTPQLLARINSPDLKPLPLESQDISVVIVGHRARVVMDLLFKNPASHQISGTLMIELPNGASPSYLAMYQGKGIDRRSAGQLGGKWLNPKTPTVQILLAKNIKLPRKWKRNKVSFDWGEMRPARVINPVQGRQVYENITRRRVDPAFSEWAGSGKFSTRIFPISANGYKRVVFAYDRSLKNIGSKVLYPLPLPDKIEGETRITTHLVGDNVIRPNVLMNEKMVRGKKTSYGYVWKNKVTSRTKGSLIFTGIPRNSRLQVLSGKDSQVSGSLLHLYYRPKIPRRQELRATGRAVFIIDTSYSSKEKLYAMSGKLLRKLLEKDDSIEEFSVIAFDVTARQITEGFVRNTPRSRRKLFRIIENIWLEGATNFSSVLQLIEKDQELGKADSFFLLSDGQINWGVENPIRLKRRFKRLISRRWLCYSFGDAAINRGLFNMLTRKAGKTIHISHGQSLSDAAKAHRQQSAVIDSIRMGSPGEFIVAGDPRQIYPGQVLEMAVRVYRSTQNLDMSIKINGETQKIEISISNHPMAENIATRSWADLYTQRLLDLHEKTADRLALALSQRFSLSNREASFIILETDAEYVQYKVKAEQLNIRKLAQIADSKAKSMGFGGPEYNDLNNESLKLIRSLKKLSLTRVWNTRKPLWPTRKQSLNSILGKSKSSGIVKIPRDIYLFAKQLARRRKTVPQALRVLSTIIELKPRDDQAARMVGYVLMEWRMYRQAELLFARVRRRRPFEPQNYLLEAMALTAQGKVREAVIRYEIVLQRKFPRFDYFVKPTAALLYKSLLKGLTSKRSNSRVIRLVRKRLLRFSRSKTPRGRLFLFWNLDNTDVDLHVKEPNGETVYYSHKESSSGGKLFWDNTMGLGPELYEHPTLSNKGFMVSVKYFGSSSVEGVAPATTMVCTMNYDKMDENPRVNWYSMVLVAAGGRTGQQVQIMPLWKP